MNILLIHQNFVDAQHPGGTRHLELGSQLVERGHQFTIVASTLDYLTGQKIETSEERESTRHTGGVRVLRAYAYPSLHRSFAWRVFSFLTFMVTSIWTALRSGPCDVVLGTSPPIFQLPSAWLVAVWKRRPFVLEVRDLWPEFAIDMGLLKNRFVIAIARWFEGFFYARAEHILVNSPAYRDYLIAKGINADRITVIPNGVDPTMFRGSADRCKLRGELKLNGHFVVTYAGALGQANDITTILRAANTLRDESGIRFLLVGDGKEKANLQKTAQALELDNVVFAGTYPKQRMHEVLAASDACLATLQNIPMFRTTYPNKVFDYMAAGKPTVLGIDGVIREVIESSDGGLFVQPGDEAQLAAAIRFLRDNPDRAEAMGQAARTYVCQHFDRRDHAVRLEEMLLRVTRPSAVGDAKQDTVPTMR